MVAAVGLTNFIDESANECNEAKVGFNSTNGPVWDISVDYLSGM